jgi:hypothetical protein
MAMWQIKVLGILSHGECPAVLHDGSVWLRSIEGGKVYLTTDRRRSKLFANEGEVFAASRHELLKLFVIRVMRDDEVVPDGENTPT